MREGEFDPAEVLASDLVDRLDDLDAFLRTGADFDASLLGNLLAEVHRLRDTPAKTPAGAVAKIRALGRALGFDRGTPTDPDPSVVASMAADYVRHRAGIDAMTAAAKAALTARRGPSAEC